VNRDDFDSLREEFFDRIRETNEAKGHDYAGDDDALSNFKEAAEHLAGIHDPEFEVWYIYFHKHWSAILTFLKEGDVKSEPIDGRIMDAVLYLILLLGLIEDKKRVRVAAPAPTAMLTTDHDVPTPYDVLVDYIGMPLDGVAGQIHASLQAAGHSGELSVSSGGVATYRGINGRIEVKL